MPASESAATAANALTRFISFADIVPGAKDVRVEPDGLIWGVPLVMAVARKNRNDANRLFRDLPEDLFSSDKIIIKSFPGQGNHQVRLLKFDDALELLMVMPGRTAKEIRRKACKILRRFFAGDETLVDEIRANAASNAPINVLARQAMQEEQAAEAVVPQDALVPAASAPDAQLILSTIVEQLAPAVATGDRATALATKSDAQAEHYKKMTYTMRGEMGAEASAAVKRARIERDNERELRAAAEKREAAAEKRERELMDAAEKRELRLTEEKRELMQMLKTAMAMAAAGRAAA